MGIFREKNSVIRIEYCSGEFHDINCLFEEEANERLKEISKILQGKKENEFVKISGLLVRVRDIKFFEVV